jgi:hypothetical protein
LAECSDFGLQLGVKVAQPKIVTKYFVLQSYISYEVQLSLLIRMIKEPNLKEIERKSYIAYHQDGLLDIFTSIYILGFAAGIILDAVYDYSFGLFLPGILVAIVLPLWIAVKKQITLPRIGFVKFGGQGSKKVTAILTGIVAFGAGFFLIFVLLFRSSAWMTFILENGLLLVGIGGLVVCSLFGYAMGLKRVYAYGVLAFALFVVGHFSGIFFADLLIVLGITVMAVGFALLVQFLRKYPLKGEESIVQ